MIHYSLFILPCLSYFQWKTNIHASETIVSLLPMLRSWEMLSWVMIAVSGSTPWLGAMSISFAWETKSMYRMAHAFIARLKDRAQPLATMFLLDTMRSCMDVFSTITS